MSSIHFSHVMDELRNNQDFVNGPSDELAMMCIDRGSFQVGYSGTTDDNAYRSGAYNCHYSDVELGSRIWSWETKRVFTIRDAVIVFHVDDTEANNNETPPLVFSLQAVSFKIRKIKHIESTYYE